jgi:hypothetical protein
MNESGKEQQQQQKIANYQFFISELVLMYNNRVSRRSIYRTHSQTQSNVIAYSSYTSGRE